MQKKIGIFDSGVGGLTVFREIAAKLPGYDYIYLADSARAPYGSRPQKNIYQFTKEAVDYLLAHDCELVILACNTASAEALRKLQREYLPMNQPEKRILGVIIPTAEELVEDNLVTRVGIIATEGTVNSKAYIRELHKLNPALHVHQMPAPLLVPLIESGRLSGKEVEACLDTYLAPLLKNKIEALILGCTHFGIIESEIMNAIGDSVRIYNQPKIVADKLAHYLNRHDTLRSKLSRGRTITYLTTGDPVQFVKLAKVISGTRKGFIEIKKVDILS